MEYDDALFYSRYSIFRDNTPGELAERKVLLDIHLLSQIGLREHGQRIPRNLPITDTRPHSPHKVRHSLEPPRSDTLESLPRLEGDAIPRDLDLHRLTGPRLYVQPSLGIRGSAELLKRWERGARLGRAGRRWDGGVGLALVDEHGGGQTGEAAVVEVGCAPVILVLAARGSRLSSLGEVVQQPCLGRVGRADHMLEISLRVPGNILFRETIAGTSNQNGNVDD